MCATHMYALKGVATLRILGELGRRYGLVSTFKMSSCGVTTIWVVKMHMKSYGVFEHAKTCMSTYYRDRIFQK